MHKARKSTNQNCDIHRNLQYASALLFEVLSEDKREAQDIKVLGFVRELIEEAKSNLT